MRKLVVMILCVALVFALAVPGLADMQKGSKGDDVVKLQARLIELGYLTGSADGSFGAHTEEALKAFQTANGLEATGIATDADVEALFADTAIDSEGNSAAPAEASEEGGEETAEAPEEAEEAEPEEEPAPVASSRTVGNGKLTLWGETFRTYQYEGSDYMYAYTFARLENTSDKVVSINSSLFEIYDADGEVLGNSEYVVLDPRTLQPGESTYIDGYIYVEGLKPEDVDDHMLDVSVKGGSDYTVTYYPVTGEYVEKDPTYYDNPMVYFTFTNDTDETLFDVRFNYALTTENGDVVYANNGSYSVGVTPGSTVIYRTSLDSSLMNYLKNNDLTIANIEAYGFTSKYN